MRQTVYPHEASYASLSLGRLEVSSRAEVRILAETVYVEIL